MKKVKKVKKVKKQVAKKRAKKKTSTKKTPVRKKKVNVPEEVSKIKNMAKEYAKDKEKTKHLLDDAFEKAQKNKGQLKRIWDDLMALFRMVRAWVTGKYKDVPLKTIVLAIVAIIYFVNPFDVIPDFIPVFGYVDDAAVVSWTIKSIYDDLQKFIKWEKPA